MARTAPKSQRDDRQFPVRLKYRLPPGGLREGGWPVESWLKAQLGTFDYAVHQAGPEFAVHLRTVADAARFAAAFPDLVPADGVEAAYGTRLDHPPHQGWSGLGPGWSGG